MSAGASATMSGMKNPGFTAVLVIFSLISAAPRAMAQAGSIEFVARATPSGGLEEPVRGFPFYLLSKSFAEVNKEAAMLYPKPDMNAFIDLLEESKEMKQWMKKNHWVRLTGEEFVNKLTVDDIMGVPEFFDAYVQRNAGDQTIVFPIPKYKPSDNRKDPAKFARLRAEYRDAIKQFLQNNPKSTAGMDLNLEELDPSNKWDQLQALSLPEIHRQTLALAQSKYLVARTETDLQGQGFLRGIPPGTYWLSTLDVAATVGEARPRWDLPVAVRAGETTRVTLTNANVVPPTRTSP
jgi:hypothetical protein